MGYRSRAHRGTSKLVPPFAMSVPHIAQQGGPSYPLSVLEITERLYKYWTSHSRRVGTAPYVMPGRRGIARVSPRAGCTPGSSIRQLSTGHRIAPDVPHSAQRPRDTLPDTAWQHTLAAYWTPHSEPGAGYAMPVLRSRRSYRTVHTPARKRLHIARRLRFRVFASAEKCRGGWGLGFGV
eukprot:3044021-Rhodomonas_salina.1